METLVGPASKRLMRSVVGEYIGELSSGRGERLNLDEESKVEVGAELEGALNIDDGLERENSTEGRSAIE